MPTSLLWFRQDLRLRDNPALLAAAERGAVVPVYVFDDHNPEAAIGGAGQWWLRHSLESLAQSLRGHQSRLILRRGDPAVELENLLAESGADAVFWNRCYEPHARERDAAIKAGLKNRGVEARSFNASLLFEPWEIETKSGKPYQVYTPFSRACFDAGVKAAEGPAPMALTGPERWPGTLELADLDLLPSKPDWSTGLRETWQPGERAAEAACQRFLETSIDAYGDARDRPAQEGTSRLSPYLHWGEIGPRQIWQAVDHALKGRGGAEPGSGPHTFLKELIWREFGYHILFHFPHLPEAALKPEFDAMPWLDDKKDWRNAWRFGRTGYPIVDAGMRQLRETGWMHNRVRMVVASFLIKDLLQDWRQGAAWFWDNLVDADLASNTLGWQWAAGCGPDAAPYFRIFNPVRQGEKFDPDGAYVRRWVPELAKLPNDKLHAPWAAAEDLYAGTGVALGDDYPRPIVDHKEARQRALAALDQIKKAAA